MNIKDAQREFDSRNDDEHEHYWQFSGRAPDGTTFYRCTCGATDEN